MKKTMPKRPRRHVQETESEKQLIAVMPSNWVYRGDIPKDYGLDGEIEIFDGEAATGEKINIQLKSTDSLKYKDQYSERIDASTFNYFRAQRYPVLIVKYISKTNKLIYRWAHGRNFIQPKKNAKSILLRFQEGDVLTEEVFKQLRVDTKNYINLDEHKLRSPIKVAITSENANVSPHSVSLEFIKYGAENDIHLISVNDLSYDAELKIRKDYVVVYFGGERATSSFNLTEKMTANPDLINHYINFGVARVLAHFKYDQLSTAFLKTSYQHIDYTDNHELVIEPLLMLHKANLYDDFFMAFKWFFNFENLRNVCTLLVFKLYENCNLGNPAERNLMEQIFNFYIDYYTANSPNSPDLGAAYYNLGNLHRSKNSNYLKAVKYYNKARKLNPKYETFEYFWRELGEIFYDNGNIGRAKFAYTKAISLGKKDSSAYPRLADCYLYEGQYQQALKNLNHYIENSKQVDEKWLLKADALKDIIEIFKVTDLSRKLSTVDRPENYSEEALLVLIREDILDIRAWFNLGVFYSKNTATHERAVVCFLWAALNNDNDVQSWANAFILSFSLGEKYLAHGVIIFSAACRINKGPFVARVFKCIEDQSDAFDKEGMKKLTIHMAQSLVFEEKFDFRINGEPFDFDSGKKVEE